MTPDERSNIAVSNFKSGMNCAQSVLLAFSDILPLERERLSDLALPFGAGMGREREVCGAVSAMLMILGLTGTGAGSDPAAKSRVYAETREMMEDFRNEFGTYICRELLSNVNTTEGGEPEKRDASYYERRPCAKFIAFAAKMISEKLEA